MQKLKGTAEFLTIYSGKRVRGRLTVSLYKTLGSPLMLGLWWNSETKTLIVQPGADFIVHGDLTISHPNLSVLPVGRYYLDKMEILKNGDIKLSLVYRKEEDYD